MIWVLRDPYENIEFRNYETVDNTTNKRQKNGCCTTKNWQSLKKHKFFCHKYIKQFLKYQNTHFIQKLFHTNDFFLNDK